MSGFPGNGAGAGVSGAGVSGAGEEAGDSAGVPWARRTLVDTPFAGDDGTAPAALTEALAAWALSGVVTAPVTEETTSPPVDAAAFGVLVVSALAAARVFVPVVAVLGEGEQVSATSGDKSADMALVTLTGRDGRRALPVFASTASLAAWDASARPVPVEAARAALSAVADGCDVMVLDPAGPVTFVVPRPAVWAIAQGRQWLPPAEDPAVLAAVAAAVAAAGLTHHRCAPDGAAALTVVLGLPPHLPAERVTQHTQQLSENLAGDHTLQERTEGVLLHLRTL